MLTYFKTKPTGSITVGKLGTWDKLIETLTFGLWSRETVDVTVKYDDKTSGIESVSYIKADDKVVKTETELQNSNEWITYESFEVNPNERFVVYARIVDNSGNTHYISTDGIIVDNENPIIEDVKPEITIVPEQPVNGIYNTDVKVAVKVEEPIGGYTEAYSGIKEIRYEILNMGKKTQEGTLYDFVESMKGEPITQDKLVQIWQKTDAIVVDKKLNNSNDVVIKVYAVDNAGNKNDASVSIKIDITNPTIDVTYDNNDGDTSFADGVYFKKSRKATIVITERNFNAEKVNVTIENEHGEVPALSDWKTVYADGNGDKTTHTATIIYSADGDYKFNISYSDEAGNENDSVNYGESLAPNAFTIDKTRPLVTVEYDNNESLNGNYYKAARTATVTVVEHNFETSRVKFDIKATDNGNPSALPAISKWATNGDVNTATISYIADSHYTFDFDYADKAGNETADIAQQDFFVDKTNPFVSITKIVDKSANNSKGKIGFVVTATDTNFDAFETVLTAVVKEGNGFKTQRLDIGKISDITNGKLYTVDNIDFDGIYTVKCTVVDKAGNAFSEVSLQHADGSSYVEKRSGNDALVTFSVNRDGSTYEIDENTADIIDKYYVKNVTNDIVVVEVNADPLKEYKVMLNGVELKENSDYTVSQSGGNGSWMKYTYTISKALFANEGEYKVVVLSKDKADNNAFSDVKNVALNFVVDRTAPVVTITGMENGGRYQTDKQLVTLIPTDDGGALNSLIVRLVSDDGTVLKELINLSGEDLEKALEDGGGKISFEIEEGMYQNIQIICDDRASDGSGTSNVYNETFKEVSVSTNALAIFFASRTVQYISIAAVAVITLLIILLVILKKRKKDKKEDKKA